MRRRMSSQKRDACLGEPCEIRRRGAARVPGGGCLPQRTKAGARRSICRGSRRSHGQSCRFPSRWFTRSGEYPSRVIRWSAYTVAPARVRHHAGGTPDGVRSDRARVGRRAPATGDLACCALCQTATIHTTRPRTRYKKRYGRTMTSRCGRSGNSGSRRPDCGYCSRRRSTRSARIRKR